MKIETKFSGEVNIVEEDILTFSKGLPAFEEETEFVLLPFAEGTPFYMLQSVKTVETAFMVVNPFHFFQDYSVKLSDSVIEILEIAKEEDVAIYTIVTIKEPFTESTVNLQGPIIINTAKNTGKQFVMVESEYDTKHKLIVEGSKVGEEK
ncbi:flagellar assembly protein FliW [Alkalihalobacterium chitinilyticum]|uniref:Flagellar assembly factor FliW n=1 Tax=Alkalihalobacterium chitinilyticum TaxID=2980103 RepID=A0ABT5VFI7_9BACI|nr:flagellar assembly protein FliW [Alkalihalobacterium chitinilyticum]MDE5414045.1 flagellar assembly protein FliW [Alkalihalobacterium chitinilyticum]